MVARQRPRRLRRRNDRRQLDPALPRFADRAGRSPAWTTAHLGQGRRRACRRRAELAGVTTALGRPFRPSAVVTRSSSRSLTLIWYGAPGTTCSAARIRSLIKRRIL